MNIDPFEPNRNVEIGAKRRRGRGATSNAASRYDTLRYENFDDGWDIHEDIPSIQTEWIKDSSKTIIAYNKSPDVPFDRSINPYRGCEHGCIYCFARPTHAFLGHSPGLDFETKLHYKPDAAKLLRAELAKKSYQPRPIGYGTNTDPYQPGEKDHRLMRELLEVMLETRHPLTIVTKGALINRDIDLLSELAELNLVHVAVSLTTLDNKLHRAMEPRAMSPTQRLRTISALSRAGIPTGVLVAPMIAKLNDQEMEAMMQAAFDAGARRAGYVTLRLPLEIATLFREWLYEHYPDRANKVMSHVQSMSGGKDYNPNFGTRMVGDGVYAKLLRKRFHAARKRIGYLEKFDPLDTSLFRRPGDDARQLMLSL